MTPDDVYIAATTAFLLLAKKKLIMKRKRARRKCTVWTKPWISNRLKMGAYHSLVQELRQTDAPSYSNFLRMDASSFDLLLRQLSPVIKRQDTRLRLSIPPEERLALTLRWLATGILAV